MPSSLWCRAFVYISAQTYHRVYVNILNMLWQIEPMSGPPPYTVGRIWLNCVAVCVCAKNTPHNTCMCDNNDFEGAAFHLQIHTSSLTLIIRLPARAVTRRNNCACQCWLSKQKFSALIMKFTEMYDNRLTVGSASWRNVMRM